MMSKNDLKRIETLETEMQEIKDLLQVLVNQQTKSAPAKAKKKTAKVSKTVKANGGKVAKADRSKVYTALGWTKKNGELKANYKFDRKAYEAKAKELGVWIEA